MVKKYAANCKSRSLLCNLTRIQFGYVNMHVQQIGAEFTLGTLH